MLAKTKKPLHVLLSVLLGGTSIPALTGETYVTAAESTSTVSAATYATVDIDTSDAHSFPYGIRGINNELQKGVVELTDPVVINRTKELDMGWIRWPGGTNVNFFNWKTGLTDQEYLSQIYANEEQYYLFMDFYKAQRATMLPERLSDFKDFLQQVGAKTVIPINPAMDSVDKVYDLAKFIKDNNVPVLYWELANEPYYWQANPKLFTGATDYLDKMRPYTAAIKNALPDAKVLISYFGPGKPWNDTLFNYPDPYWDGINFHRYDGGGKTAAAAIKDANEVLATTQSTLDAQYLAKMQNPNQPILIAEYGVELNDRLGESVYHGIFNTEGILRNISDDHVKAMGGYRLYNGYLNPNNRNLTRAVDNYQRGLQEDAAKYDFQFYYVAPAVYTKVMDKAINNSSVWWGTTVTGGPTVDRETTTMPALYTKAFRGDYGNRNYLIIVNKSNKPQDVVVKLNGSDYNGTFTKVFAKAPLDKNGNPDPVGKNSYSNPLVVEQTETNAANPVTAAPYSVTRLEWAPAEPQADQPPRPVWITHADATSPGAVALKWLAADGAVTYNIKYGTTPSNLSSVIRNIPGSMTTRAVSGLAAGTTYYFQVESVGRSGITASENTPAVTTAAPAAPLLRTVYPESSGAVAVEWQSVPGATGYKVRYKLGHGGYGSPQHADSESGTLDVGNTAGTIIPGLVNGMKYDVQVTAYNGYGLSDYSDKQSVTVLHDPVYAPNDLKVTAKTDTSAALAWTPSYSETYKGYFEEGDGTGDGWTVESGTAYTIVDHPSASRATRVFKADGAGPQVITRGDAEWQDYEIEADLDVGSYNADGRVGLVGRFQDLNNYYSYTYDNAAKSFGLYKIVNGTATVLQSKTLTALSAEGYTPNVKDMDLRLVLRGTKLTAMVNDNLILSATDSSLSSGRTGLYANQTAYFDEVILRNSVTWNGTYRIYRSTRPDAGYTEVADGVSGTVWTDTTLQPNAIYYYKLKGVDSSGNLSAGYSNITSKR